MNRRDFNKAAAAAGAATALTPFGIVRAQAQKLKVGVLLPRSGVQALIGQSCQKGADLAPAVLKQVLGVDIEIMNADTESNADTARTRAERLIQEGANVLVGAFDSGHTAAIAQVAEQRGVPFIINIAAAPQITEQGYKFVFRNFPTAIDLTRNGLALMGEIFRTTNTVPRTAVFMHVNDTFGQAMSKGIGATLPRLTELPFKVVETIPYDPAAKDLTVEVSKAKATNADFLMLVCRLNDAIILRREMVKQRWNPMGIISPGSPGLYEEQYNKSLGKYAEYAICNTVWYNPKSAMTKTVSTEFKKRNPKDELALPRHQRGLHLRRDHDRRGRVQARAQHRREDARRGDPPDQHPGGQPHVARRRDQVQPERPGRRQPVGGDPEPEGQAERHAARRVRRGQGDLPLARLQEGVAARPNAEGMIAS